MARQCYLRRAGFRRRSRPEVEPLEGRTLLASNVLSYRYDPTGDGLNPNETALAPASVNASDFGKLFASSIDGYAFAESLYVAGVGVASGGVQSVHNVVYVATEHDSLYAFDADSGALLWKDSLLHPIHGGTVTTVPTSELVVAGLGPEEGITSTPVIDAATGTIYVVAETKEVVGGVAHYTQQIHAIALGSGAEKAGGPAVIADTTFDGTNYAFVSGPSIPGNGFGSSGGLDHYNALRQSQRTALAENNGTIYVASAAQGDALPYHGWILGFDAHTLGLTSVFNATPNGEAGGIWAGGGGLSFDAQGDIFLETGNGTFDGFNGSDPNVNSGGPGPILGLNAQGFPALGDYGDSVLKLAPDPTSSSSHPNINGWGLKVVDYFTPNNESYLGFHDLDLGSQQVLLLPPSLGSAAHPNTMIVAGKEGTIYLLDQNNLGKFGTTTDAAIQELKGAFPGGSITSPASFNGSFYYAPTGGHLERFAVANASFTPISGQLSPDTFTYRGAAPSISSDGSTGGIVWALDHDSSQLRAYDATNPSVELYTSAQSGSRDTLLGNVTTFSTPTVVNGKVYVATSSGLVAFGVLPASGPVLPLTFSATPFGPSNPDVPTAEVTALYNIVLGRAPEAGGLAAWVGAIKGGVPFSTVAADFLNSVPYQDRVVASYYQEFLGRAGSAAEIAAWVNLMQQGMTEEQVITLFLTSTGFNGLHPDNGSFIQVLYNDLLGRTASAAEVSAWQSVMAGGMTRVSVVNAFLHSSGAYRRAVDGLYEIILGRPADSGGESFYIAGLQAGSTLVQVAQAFLSSAEFAQRAGATVI